MINVDNLTKEFDALAYEYVQFLRAHSLPDEDAESLILDDTIRAQHGRYLSQFIARWDALERAYNS